MNECKQLSARRVSLILAAFQNDALSDKRWARNGRGRGIKNSWQGERAPWDWGGRVSNTSSSPPLSSFLPSPLSSLNRPPLWSVSIPIYYFPKAPLGNDSLVNKSKALFWVSCSTVSYRPFSHLKILISLVSWRPFSPAFPLTAGFQGLASSIGSSHYKAQLLNDNVPMAKHS